MAKSAKSAVVINVALHAPALVSVADATGTIVIVSAHHASAVITDCGGTNEPKFCKFKTGFTESQKADSARADSPGILTFFS